MDVKLWTEMKNLSGFGDGGRENQIQPTMSFKLCAKPSFSLSSSHFIYLKKKTYLNLTFIYFIENISVTVIISYITI